MVTYITLYIILAVALTILITYISIIKPQKKQIQDLMNALESKKEADEQKIQDKTEPGRIDPEEYLLDNLVTKTSRTRKGRQLSEYTLNNMPGFKTVDEALGFGLGLTNLNDPTIFNLAQYGCVMKTDQFFAFKLVMKNIFTQLQKLNQ